MKVWDLGSPDKFDNFNNPGGFSRGPGGSRSCIFPAPSPLEVSQFHTVSTFSKRQGIMFSAPRVMKILQRALVESFRTAMCSLAFFETKLFPNIPLQNFGQDISKENQAWISSKEHFWNNLKVFICLLNLFGGGNWSEIE